MNGLFILRASLLCWLMSTCVAYAQLPAGSTVTFKTKNSKQCIGVDGAQTENDISLGRFNCGDDKAPNQRWRVERRGGEHKFVNVKSDKCIGVDGASKDPNARIAQYVCDGSSNQRWKLFTAPGEPNLVREFRNVNSDHCLGVPNSQQLLKQFECNKTPGIIQEWRIVIR
jgi:hypothetical protein